MVRTVGTSSLSKLNTVPVPTIYLKKYSFDFFIVVVVGASQMGSQGAANSSLKQFEILLPYQYFWPFLCFSNFTLNLLQNLRVPVAASSVPPR